jgi:hypothetical protein
MRPRRSEDPIRREIPELQPIEMRRTLVPEWCPVREVAVKKKQKTVGNGGTKAKLAESQPRPEERASPAAPAQSTMNLFDSGKESRAEADISRAVCIWSISGAANSQEANDNNNDPRGGEQ